MNFTVDIPAHTFNTTANFLRLVEHIRQRLHERQLFKEHQRRTKIYSLTHYIEHIRRSLNDNPIIARALFRFYNIIKNFSSQNNQFTSTVQFDSYESKMSLEAKTSLENLRKISQEIDPKVDLSKISLTASQSTEINRLERTKSTTHYIQSTDTTHLNNGLLTKATLAALNKAPHQRTEDEIQVLVHLVNTCATLHHLPAHVRHYTARSLLLLTYLPNTILTRQNSPPFLVYIIVYGQCNLLLETKQTAILGHQLNIGDVYGEDTLQSIPDHRLNGLITNEINRCSVIVFFPRDIRAYENYLSDMMKQSLLEQLRAQSIFSTIQWRNDILHYFLKWSNYRQYAIDEVIYGNEDYEHNNLYFILHGQISFVRLFEFPSILIEHPEFHRDYQKIKKQNRIQRKTQENTKSLDLHTVTPSLTNSSISQINSKGKTTWRFLEVFILSNGHYFGFESTTIHSWYLTRSAVDLISIPKTRFQELGYFAPMIFDKLRQDFLDIYPDEISIRNSYINHLQTMKFNEHDISTIQFTHQPKRSTITTQDMIIHWIPEYNILNQYKEKLRLVNKLSCD